MSTPKPILVSIEGCIGSGKSTLINKLKADERCDYEFIDEPVGIWQSLKNEDGEDLLQVFYKDNKRYSYTFQNCALLSRAIIIQNHITKWKSTNPTKNRVFITERCIETDYNVFALMLRDNNMMDGIEWDLYKMWYNYISTNPLGLPLSGVIHLDIPVKTCMNNIKKRNRLGEENIDQTYIESLIKYQNEWLYSNEKSDFLVMKLDEIIYNENIDIVSEIGEFVNYISKNL